VQKDHNMSLIEFETVIVGATNFRNPAGDAAAQADDEQLE